jgi:hypothetical protein
MTRINKETLKPNERKNYNHNLRIIIPFRPNHSYIRYTNKTSNVNTSYAVKTRESGSGRKVVEREASSSSSDEKAPTLTKEAWILLIYMIHDLTLRHVKHRQKEGSALTE